MESEFTGYFVAPTDQASIDDVLAQRAIAGHAHVLHDPAGGDNAFLCTE